MAMQVFADEELVRLREFPEISREELFRFFTLTPADIAFLTPGRGRGPAERNGLSVALCTLPWLGFVPDQVDYRLAIDQMRRQGRRIEADVLSHVSPAYSANINFFGAIEVDIDAELAQLGPTGYRPLRVRDTLF